MTTRRMFLKTSAAALAAPALPRLAAAQSYPTRQIRAMVPFAAGSSLDIVGRIVMDPLSKQLGQTIVIENRGGAGGSIGTAAVAKAEPDGHTLLIQASAHSAAPAAYPKLAYDPVRDFSAVIPFGTIPNVTVVHPSRGFKTVNDLVAAAKKSGKFTYGSAGVGSATHWAAERLRLAGGYDAVHVPFKGGPEALTEVMAGRVDFTCMGISAALPLIQDGKLVALAVSLGGALGRAAERADDARGRAEGLRLQLLDGTVRAVEDAARHRRAALRRDAEGAGAAGGAGPLQAARHRAVEDDVGGVRRHGQARGRGQHRAREGGGAEVQLRRLVGWVSPTASQSAGGCYVPSPRSGGRARRSLLR